MTWNLFFCFICDRHFDRHSPERSGNSQRTSVTLDYLEALNQYSPERTKETLEESHSN
jgi:hypothetical protein